MNIDYQKTFLALFAQGKITQTDIARVNGKKGTFDAVVESGFVLSPDVISAGSEVYFTKLYKDQKIGELVPFSEFVHFKPILDGWLLTRGMDEEDDSERGISAEAADEMLNNAIQGIASEKPKRPEYIFYINAFELSIDRIVREALCREGNKKDIDRLLKAGEGAQEEY